MDSAFWHGKWQDDQIGFHEGEVNADLRRHWSRLQAAVGERVLVPLCGKAHDLGWLREQGHRVLGVELSPIACRAFFAERGIEPEILEDRRFTRYVHDDLELWCGDFFALEAEDAADVSLFYDRAALIALPEALRHRYVTHLGRLGVAACRGLLVSLCYRSDSFRGPPFSVPDEQVHALYDPAYEVERVSNRPLPPDDPLVRRGLAGGTESVFVLRRRARGRAGTPTRSGLPPVQG